jgi:hypothetical protein
MIEYLVFTLTLGDFRARVPLMRVGVETGGDEDGESLMVLYQVRLVGV